MRIKSSALAVTAVLAWAGCSKPSEPQSDLAKNVERTVGEGQKNTGMLGGNDAPNDAGVADGGP